MAQPDERTLFLLGGGAELTDTSGVLVPISNPNEVERMSLLGTSGAFGKDVWLPGIYRQLENALGELFNIVDAQEDWRVEGRNIFGKVDTGDSLGQGVIAEGGDFRSAGDPTYAEFKLQMSRLAHTVEVSFDEFEMINSNDAAAVPVVQEKMTKGVMAMQRDIVRQLWRDGTAKLARTTDTAAGLTFTMSAIDGGAGGVPANQIDRDRLNWIVPGRIKLDVRDATTGVAIANGSGRTVTDVNTTTNVVTVDTAGGNIDPTANTVITWAGNVTSPGNVYTSLEYPGITAAIDDANIYQNINRATAGNSFWKAVVVNGATTGTNELPTLDRVLKLLNRMAANSDSGEQPGPTTHRAVSSFGVQAAIMEYLAPGIRYTTNLPSFDMAPKGFQDMGIPLVNMLYKADIHAAHNNLFVYRPDCLHFIRPKHKLWDILDFVPGTIQGIWNLKNASVASQYAAAGQAFLTGQISFGTHRPNNLGRLNDIVELGT